MGLRSGCGAHRRPQAWRCVTRLAVDGSHRRAREERLLRVPGALHPRSGWAAAVVIAAIVGACTLGTGASSTPPSPATTPSEQAAVPSVEASPEETPIPTPSATPSPTPPPPGLVDLDPVDGTAL